MIKKLIHIHALIKNALNFNTIQFVMTVQASNASSKSMSAKTARGAHSDHHVQKQKKAKIEN